MSVEAVKEYLKPFGLSGQVLELAESSATVELAAHALGTSLPASPKRCPSWWGRRPSS